MDMYKEHRQYVTNVSSDTSDVRSYRPISSSFRASSIFTIITFFMLLIMVYKALSGSVTSFTFTSILNSLDSAPTIDMSFLRTFSENSAVYDIPIIGAFLRTISGIVSVSLWLVLGIIQVILYIAWVVGFLFV